MKKILFLLSAPLLVSLQLLAQINPTGGRDTSFTVQKSFLQESKHHPGISLADSVLPAGVEVHHNLPYASPALGRSLLLDIYTPPGATQARPAILMIHGGGWRSGDRSQNNSLAGQLAARGYVAVPVDYRLSTEALRPPCTTLRRPCAGSAPMQVRTALTPAELPYWAFRLVSTGGPHRQHQPQSGLRGNRRFRQPVKCGAGGDRY